VNVHISRPTVLVVFEMMMLEISQRMAHPTLSARLRGLPDNAPAPFDGCPPGYVVELRIDYQLRSERAFA
jgi:hypothetical protein